MEQSNTMDEPGLQSDCRVGGKIIKGIWVTLISWCCWYYKRE